MNVNYGTPAEILFQTGAPDTSQEAAFSIDTTRLEAMVHEAISNYGEHGCIADDLLIQFEGFAYSSITARFSGLERKGLISCGPDKRKGLSGRNQRVMRNNA